MRHSTHSERNPSPRGAKRKFNDTDVDGASYAPGKNKRYVTRSGRVVMHKDPLFQPKEPAKPIPGTLCDKHFFYQSGDVIVELDSVLFCIHVGKLREAGGLFEDMLKCSAPDPEATICGRPSFRLPIDLLTVREFRVLLALLYNRIVLHKELPGDTWVFWDAATTLLEVSSKLSMWPIRKKALAALKLLFPSSESGIACMPIVAGYESGPQADIFHRFFPIRAVQLFIEHQVPSMLPMAYYHAAQLPLEDIIRGVQVGTQLIKFTEDEMLTVLSGRDLLKAARRNCLHVEMLNKVNNHAFWEGGLCDGCEGRTVRQSENEDHDCMGFLTTFCRKADAAGFFDNRPDALETLPAEAQDMFGEYLCGPCWEELQPLMMQGLELSWKNLPVHFGLGTWETITEEEREVDSGWHVFDE